MTDPAPALPEESSTHPAQFSELQPPSREVPINLNIVPLMDVNIKVTVMLGETRMTLGDLMKLGLGSVVQLETAAGDPINVFVNERLYARGEVVVVDEAFGVKITEVVNPQTPATGGK